jgi:hypothetical protein
MNRFICYGLLLFSLPVLADHGYQNHENYFDNYPSNDTTISNAAYDADTGIWDFSHASGSETWNIIWSPYNSTGDSYNYSFEMRAYGDTGSFVSNQRLIRMDAGKRNSGTCAYDAPYNCSWGSRFWNDGVVDVSATLDYSGTGYSDWTLYSGSHDISGWNDSGLAWAYWHVSGLTGDGTNGPQIRNFYGCVDCTLPGLIDDGTAELFTYVNDGVCDYTAIEDPDCTNEVYVDETYETASADGQDDGSSSSDGQDDGSSSGYEEETYYEPEPETYADTGGQEETYQDDGSTGDTGQEETYQEPEPQEEYSNDQVVQTEPGPPNINPDAPLANDMDVVKNSIAGSFRRTVNSRSIEFLQSVGGINNMSGGPSGYNSQSSGSSNGQGGTGSSGGAGNMMVAQNDPIGWNINQIMMNQGIMGNTQEEEAVGDNPLGSDELEEELSIKDLGGLGINSIKQPNLLDNKNWYSDRNILEQSGIYDDQEFYKQKEMYNEVEWYGT